MAMSAWDNAHKPIENASGGGFMSSIVSAHEDLGRIAERLAVLTERLCGVDGPKETGGINSRVASVPNGIFEDASERGSDMCQKLNRISNCITRIEQSLP